MIKIIKVPAIIPNLKILTWLKIRAAKTTESQTRLQTRHRTLLATSLLSKTLLFQQNLLPLWLSALQLQNPQLQLKLKKKRRQCLLPR